jgi:hypothetical protein
MPARQVRSLLSSFDSLHRSGHPNRPHHLNGCLQPLAGCWIQHGNLLEVRVKITTDNDDRSAPFLRALVDSSPPSLLAREEPTTLSNQLIRIRPLAQKKPLISGKSPEYLPEKNRNPNQTDGVSLRA